MTDYTMTIGGDAVATEASFGVVNPATGEVFAEAPSCTRSQLDAAFEAAHKAQRDWRSDEPARRAALLAVADVLMGAGDVLNPVITSEQGKPLDQAAIETFGSAIWCQYYANLETPAQVIQDDETAYVEVVRRPLGVVAAITPWNFPLGLALLEDRPGAARRATPWCSSPRRSPRWPRCCSARSAQSVLPPGVLNVVTGGDQLGADRRVTRCRGRSASPARSQTGKNVAASAAADLKRVTLELGGNDAAILLADADPVAPCPGLLRGRFFNTGQACSAAQAHLRPRGALRRGGRGARGRGSRDQGRRGHRARRAARPDQQRARSSSGSPGSSPRRCAARGERVAAGGHPMDGPGYFFEPTILADLTDGVRIVDEEQFGPALPVIAYRDLDDAVERANATSFGLSGSVWGADVERAQDVAARLECGTAWVNTHLALSPIQPFGGFKWSGVGVENGPWGLSEFSEIQAVHTKR